MASVKDRLSAIEAKLGIEVPVGVVGFFGITILLILA